MAIVFLTYTWDSEYVVRAGLLFLAILGVFWAAKLVQEIIISLKK